MRRRARAGIALTAVLCMAASSRGPKMVAIPAPPPGEARIELDLVAIPAPSIDIIGRVLLKDGITPVPGAALTLTDVRYGEPRDAVSGSGGRFRLGVQAGDYRLKIRRGMEIFESGSTYRVPTGAAVEVDFLLLHDVEPPAPPVTARKNGQKKTEEPLDPPTLSIRRGPDPLPEGPRVVGTVVDIPRVSTTGRRNRWAEALGFLGSLLAVALASN